MVNQIKVIINNNKKSDLYEPLQTNIYGFSHKTDFEH